MTDFATEILQSFIVAFAEKLFPHRDFIYAGVFDSKHRIESIINIDGDAYAGSLRIELEEDYRDFNLYELDDSEWTAILHYTTLKMINVKLAYDYLTVMLRPFMINILPN